MGNVIQPTEASRQYATAYTAHYQGRDLPAALQLYTQVRASHPEAPEAGYSRAQIQNIIKTVVPDQEALDAHLELALVHLQH